MSQGFLTDASWLPIMSNAGGLPSGGRALHSPGTWWRYLPLRVFKGHFRKKLSHLCQFEKWKQNMGVPMAGCRERFLKNPYSMCVENGVCFRKQFRCIPEKLLIQWRHVSESCFLKQQQWNTKVFQTQQGRKSHASSTGKGKSLARTPEHIRGTGPRRLSPPGHPGSGTSHSPCRKSSRSSSAPRARSPATPWWGTARWGSGPPGACYQVPGSGETPPACTAWGWPRTRGHTAPWRTPLHSAQWEERRRTVIHQGLSFPRMLYWTHLVILGLPGAAVTS